MIAYLDSSVLLRIVLREPDRLAEWDQITVPITSVLTRLEMARTLDRNAVLRTASEAELAEKRAETDDLLRRIDAIALDDSVLQAAAPSHPAFAPRDEYRATPVTDLLRYTQAAFSGLFRKSPVKRAKLAGMQRNVAALTAEADRGILKA